MDVKSPEYKDRNENGWYLLVINRDTKEVVQNFDYKEIKKIRMENITTTAIKKMMVCFIKQM